MPNTRRHSYDLNFKLKIVAEAEAVNNNREIAREYGISESMVRKWRNQQHVLFTGELKMTAKRASMGRYRPKDPELDQQKSQWPAISVLCLRYLEYLSPFIWEIWQISYFVARIYSAIRRTPSLDQISIKQAHFLQKNAAPYNRKNTV